ncbi:heterokaryon incompatibility protein-domain-containing protein [Hypomontagnella monticulosa]|nr:heterokaryon incompatibility protein-domain-containing protein [Hypomontagnella monticulosa]
MAEISARNKQLILLPRQPYCYEPIDRAKRQIRLLELSPGTKDEPIHGELKIANLGDNPDFDAVSYVWGDPTPCFTVIVNHKLLKVPASSHKLLVGMRDRHQSMTLWIDSICINQEDVLERGHQVRFMHAIYTTARMVRVWLDTHVDFSSHVFQMARRLEVNQNLINWDMLPWTLSISDPHEVLQVDSFSPEFWQPIYDVLNNPYFGRIWTQQELFLARDIQFHSSSGNLPPESLFRFDYAIFSQEEYKYRQKRDIASLFPYIYIGFLLTSSSITLFNMEAYTLLGLSLQSRDLDTAEPVDRVYGMLGLANDCDENDIMPDYSLGLVEVFGLVVQHYVRKHQLLSFLCYYETRITESVCSCGSSSSPTWLPTPDKNSDLIVRLADCFASSTIRLSPSSFEFKDMCKVLGVQGIRVDSISMAARLPMRQTPLSELQQLESHWATSERTYEKYINLLVAMIRKSDDYITAEDITAALSALYSLPALSSRPDLDLLHIITTSTLPSTSPYYYTLRVLNRNIIQGVFVETEMGRLGISHRTCIRN